ncbi:GNAT family N-acetyltransferase [Shimia sp. R10_1]|uniref:GNAT family N-acetyltransferase n=1 Tax=Shimia sp. R10_1 TaxID=2821095 RepID=UPI001ADC619F|nr:GNAT family N-acetyltransferase [Shimia sp. R10_1]MBO9472133.1 GNAT family N-acetyltransferase [Shimia sp. R10_1]
MSGAVHLATEADFHRLDALVSAFHAEMQIASSPEKRADALIPLLNGSPYGSAYLIGPRRAPVGYLVVTFSWSVEFAGMDAAIDEIYVRPSVRRRGMASSALHNICQALENSGITAFHLTVERDNPASQKFYEKAGFKRRDQFALMCRLKR